MTTYLHLHTCWYRALHTTWYCGANARTMQPSVPVPTVPTSSGGKQWLSVGMHSSVITARDSGPLWRYRNRYRSIR